MKQVLAMAKMLAAHLAFGSIFISFCAAAMAWQTLLLAGVPQISLVYPAFIFSATLGLYNIHRLQRIRKSKPAIPRHAFAWALQHQFTVFMLAIVGFGASGFFLFQLRLISILFLLTCAALCILYEWPLIRFRNKLYTMRNLMQWKIFIITAVWVVATVIVPLLESNVNLNWINWTLLCLERSCLVFMIALAFDRRDIVADEQEGIRTLPVSSGVKKTAEFFSMAASLLAVFILIQFVLYQFQPAVALAMLLSAAAAYVICRRADAGRTDFYFSFAVDGIMLLQTALVWLAVEQKLG